MIKVAIFTEGQTELIFIRYLLFQVVDNEKLSFESIKLHGGRMFEVPYNYSCPDPEVHFMIINAEGDGQVLSAIMEREKRLFEKGFDRIIGLRDMYSSAYHNKSPGVINEEISQAFFEGAHKVISSMSKPNDILLYFAIMEIEAWFLGMYNLFQKIDKRFSVDYIENELNINIREVDPQVEFYKPSKVLEDIFELVGRRYSKSRHDSESICSRSATSDLDNAIENKRCKSFKDFYDVIKEYKNA